MIFEEIIEKNYSEIAKELMVYGEDHKIWVFNGNLGAGKTTLIKALFEQLWLQVLLTTLIF